jgi:hypothetical protein
LTEEQKKEARRYAVSLGMPEEMIFFLDNTLTGYGTVFDDLVIGTDVLPLNRRSRVPNDNISLRGVIAHEIVGHRETVLSGRSQDFKALDEAQASIRAARFAHSLSKQERMDLLKDGICRLKDEGIKLRDVKSKLHINER